MTKKKKPSKLKTYSENEVVVILEDIRSQFMAFGEGQQVISDKVDGLENKFDNLENRFDNLEIKVDKLQDDVTDIKHKLSKKVDLEDFQKLEKRVIKLEKLAIAKKL